MPPYTRRTVAVEPLYGMATACVIATANLKMKKVITPRYNPTVTRTACKDRDKPLGDPEANADSLRPPQVSLDSRGVRPPYPSRRSNATWALLSKLPRVSWRWDNSCIQVRLVTFNLTSLFQWGRNRAPFSIKGVIGWTWNNQPSDLTNQ